MWSKFLWIFFISSISFSSQSYAEDFFRVSSGALLISNHGMKYTEVMDIIKKEKSWTRIRNNHYILEASAGGEFHVRLRFSGGMLIKIVSKKVRRENNYQPKLTGSTLPYHLNHLI